jgi:bleomycin hydrolase
MKKYLYFLATLFIFQNISAQLKKNETFTNTKGSEYRFKVIKHLDNTPVKSQDRTGTCWSFSTMSFLESELLRKGKGQHDLAEMWIARNAYRGKAKNYLLMDGHFNFGEGGEFHDIPWVIKKYGIVPQYAYPGIAYGGNQYNHAELQAVLDGMIKALNKKPMGGKLSPVWEKAYMKVVDSYLGDVPDNTENFTFDYKGKKYTPKSFAKAMDLNMDDYVELTSFTHHPYYSKFVLELPDNWQMAQAYNIPLDEFLKVAENAINKGYTFAWAADVSEKGFSHRKGLAIVPEDERTAQKTSKEKYKEIDGEKIPNAFYIPVPEKQITTELRQEAFENRSTTDDHGMHAVGIAKDQNGKKYFIIKNSWGKSNELNGYFLASYPYYKYKTIAIFIHKDALPKDLKEKLGIK